MKLPISQRLLACARFVAKGDRVADVGCDHGYLSIYLLTGGIARSVIASDVKEMPLMNAMHNARKYGVQDRMEIYLSDGLRNIPRDFDCVVCAGMGADTMVSILEAAPWLKCGQYHLVLQCQSKTPMLRQYLSESGWRIAEEAVLRDGKFLYTVMAVSWDPAYPRLTAGEWYFPPALLENPSAEVPAYYRWVRDGMRLSASHRDDDTLRAALAEVEALPETKELSWLKEEGKMTTVADILAYLETLAPPYMKMDWDHVGLNCGRMDAPVTKILVALDPFAEACREAKDIGAQLLVTHHALLWEPGFITDQDAQGRQTLFLIENGIAHINAHTNLDCAPGGVNDALAEKLGLEYVEVIDPVGTDAAGRPYGLLRKGTVPEQSLGSFLAHVKTVLGCDGLRYVNSAYPVCHVAVGGGACGDAVAEAKRAGCDTLVTADVKYNQFRAAYDLGINLIDAGHFYTENPVCAVLADKLAAAFPKIQVKISENHADPMKFY